MATRTDQYVSRAEAIALLGIKPATLYAYVSRGWIRSIRMDGARRLSLYSRTDIEALQARSAARAGAGPVAASAMRWGEPIIPTTITEIRPEGPFYRGKSAIALARAGASYEAVAELLWTGLLHEDVLWPVAELPPEIVGQAGPEQMDRAREYLMSVFAMLTLQLGVPRAGNPRAPLDPFGEARRLSQAMIGCMGMLGPKRAFDAMQPGEPVAAALNRVLGVAPTEENRAAMEAILVLLADHELTSSTFAARVAASAGALLLACINAALATNSGVEIARLYNRIEGLVASPEGAGPLAERIAMDQSTGMAPPGFNHPVYPDGDPRADYLLDLAARHSGRTAVVGRLLDGLAEARGRLQLYPRVEMGVVVLGLAMRLPMRASAGLFTIARVAGWVAHVLEQRTAGYLLRPRAKFIAPAA